jgi:nitrogenase molybdenum-iron protein alpha/beta subunit
MREELKFDQCTHSRDPIVGCALEGVATMIAGLRDASIVIHSPQGCSSTVGLGFDNHEVDFTQRRVACTRLFETDIIMGAGQKLEDLILQADGTFGTALTFVVGTCAADIIGEDLGGICGKMQPKVKTRLVPVSAGGFRGNAYDGMELGLQSLEVFIGREPLPRKPRTVNLIAPAANLNPTWWGDLAWVTRVLAEMDVTVQAVLSRDTTPEQLAGASAASANILLSHDVGHPFTQRMKKRFDVPLILDGLPLPVGLKNTARWLTALGEHFGASAVAGRMIREGERRVVEILRRRGLMIIPRYRNCRVAVSADATLGIPLVRMLFEELEMLPEVLLLRTGRPEAKALLDAELTSLGLSAKVAFGVDGYQVEETLVRQGVDAVLGSSWERYIAEGLEIPLTFDLISPTNRDFYVDRAYFGYEGMLNLLEAMGNDWETALRSKRIAWERYATE